MDDKILEILMELKEGQEEIRADIKKLDTKMDNIHSEIKKQIFDFEKANFNKHNEMTDTFRFVKKKIGDIEEDVFTLKEKIAIK